MFSIDVNADLGEGLDTDALLIPYITSANIACGYHAGDETIMQETVSLALRYHVAIGAHPGFSDKINFGRTEISLPLNEIYQLIQHQISLLTGITDTLGCKLNHVKPHGALYNMSARDPLLANTIAKAVYDVNPLLILFGLSGSHSITEAQKAGLRTASEVFADRSYTDTGSLTPRSQSNALLNTDEEAISQVLQMIEQKKVSSVSGKEVPIIAETICIHGDGAHAVSFAKKIHHTLQQKNIGIQSI